jgi:hypothetical protein
MTVKLRRLFGTNTIVADAKRSPLLEVRVRSINGEIFGKSQKKSF